MKRVISTPRLVLLFSYVILIARASAETSEGLKNAINSHRQLHREARRLNVTAQNIQSRPAQGLDRFDRVVNSNWCGAVQTNIPEYGGTFYAIENTQWIIPNVRIPPDANGEPAFGVYAWAGIDGAGSCPGLLQAGTLSMMERDNSGNYDTYVTAFAEWFPSPPVTIAINVSTGHTVEVSILATSSSQADIQITNLSTGEVISASLASPSAAYNLCGLSAEYIVEAPFDPSTKSSLPLPQFNDFILGYCIAETSEGDTIDLTSAALYQIENQNGVVLAMPEFVSGQSDAVQITYISSGLSKG